MKIMTDQAICSKAIFKPETVIEVRSQSFSSGRKQISNANSQKLEWFTTIGFGIVALVKKFILTIIPIFINIY